MFDRETRRAKILEARGRARRDARGKSAHGEVKSLFLFKTLDSLNEMEYSCRKEKRPLLMVVWVNRN